ncbi:MAG: hypothetical protein KF799_11900 [Bdellovibrionales bacterium]|nr:hypothetical protein [Bdellovibrionales bacterium]
MKKQILATVMFMLSAPTAFAQTPLPAGTIALQTVGGDVVSTAPLCPAGVKCITNGTIVNLVLGSGGCLDQLLPLTYEKVGDEVIVHAQVAVNEQSSKVNCATHTIFTEQLALIGVYKPFKLRFLSTGPVVTVK